MSYSSEVLADAPVGYWRLSGTVGAGVTAPDSSGGGHSGTYAGSASSATGLLVGDSDTAASFTGGYMRVPFYAGMESQAITVEAIIKPSAATLSGNHPIVTRWVTPDNGQRFILWVSSGKVQGYVYSAVNANATGATSLVAGQTYHVAMTYDGANIRVYVNGVQDGIAAWTSPINGTGGPYLDVARVSDATVGTLTADEVALYAKVLPQARLAAHYAAATAAATSATTGTLSGSLSPFTTQAAGTSTPPAISGALAATLAPFTTALAGTSAPPPTTAALAGSLAPFTATLAGAIGATPAPVSGTLQAALPAFAAELVGSTPASTNPVHATDTTYGNDGYSYGGAAQVDYDTPVAPPPPGLVRRDVRRVHQSLPTPTLVRGRPQ